MMGLIAESQRHPRSADLEQDKLLVHHGLNMLISFTQNSRLAKAAVLILRSRILGTEFSER